MTLFDVFDWLELTAIGSLIRESTWLFPVIESGHLLGLAMLGGSILVVDLRLLGVGLKDRSAAYLLDQTAPWQRGAIAILIATGLPLFLSEAVKCYFSPAFSWKMGGLAVALIFTFGVRNRLVRDRPDLQRRHAAAIGAFSISIWLAVAVAGRWIGFS
jgi:hypothetical protein